MEEETKKTNIKCPRCGELMDLVRTDEKEKYAYLRCGEEHNGLGEVIHTEPLEKVEIDEKTT